MQKIVPDLDVFLDVASLRSGDDWQTRIFDAIGSRDVFYLFWSRQPKPRNGWKQSGGWRFRPKGLDFIDPVPLESPKTAPPPEELASRHFGDWTLNVR
jgi:hypothetical protein